MREEDPGLALQSFGLDANPAEGRKLQAMPVVVELSKGFPRYRTARGPDLKHSRARQGSAVGSSQSNVERDRDSGGRGC